MKAVYGRFGISDTLITYNEPQFSWAEFAVFAKTWRFEHKTFSTLQPQSNGNAENAFKIVKEAFLQVQGSWEGRFSGTTGLAQHTLCWNRYQPCPESRDHITPHYVNLGFIKLPDIVKLYTCQLLYDHLIDEKPSNYTVSLVSEQHNYATRSASLQHLKPGYSRINIRKFCPTVIGCYYWNDLPLSIRNLATRKHFKKALFQYYFAQY